MLKKLVGTALAATLTLSLSAKEEEDHVVDFNQVVVESSGRGMRHLVSTVPGAGDTYAYLFGKAELVDGKSGKALDFSDTRSRTEFHMKTAKYYDLNNGTISFDISPLKPKFGITGEATIFEESNGDTVFGLYIDDQGRLKLKVSAKFDLTEDGKEVVYDEKFFKEQENPTIKFDNRNDLDKAVDEKKAADDAAKKAVEDQTKKNFEVKEYIFHSFQLGDTREWKPGEWQKVAVSWDLRRGFFVLYVNGRYAIRSFATEGSELGVFLDRGTSGSVIKFAPGNDGFSGLIDNLRFSKKVVDQEVR
jgi:hypothetical protein